MIDAKNPNTKLDFKSPSTATDYSEALLNLNVYKELDENPNQNLDLVSHIKNQMQQLQTIHQRKMFLIREIAAVSAKKN